MTTHGNRRPTSAKPPSKHGNNKSRYDRTGNHSEDGEDGQGKEISGVITYSAT
jgi:hypothetical protein